MNKSILYRDLVKSLRLNDAQQIQLTRWLIKNVEVLNVHIVLSSKLDLEQKEAMLPHHLNHAIHQIADYVFDHELYFKETYTNVATKDEETRLQMFIFKPTKKDLDANTSIEL